MRKIRHIFCLLGISVCAFATEGALPGAFSVSSTKKVYFSKGNLQYQVSTNTWRFAEHQYDINSKSYSLSSTYKGWIDLFGWSTGSTTYGVSSSGTSLSYSGNFVDWGKNKISNGGNIANQWETLSKTEWQYLFAHSRYFRATVNGQTGIVLLPDNWPGGFSFWMGTDDFTTNIYTASQWAACESTGAVFLPCAGYCASEVRDVGKLGRYWSSTPNGKEGAWELIFNQSWVQNPNYSSERWYKKSVRLVTSTPPPASNYTITFNANGGLIPTNGNMGNTPAGHTTTLNADRTQGTVIATIGTSAFWSMTGDCPTREGYTFDGWWTEPTGGSQVYDATGACIKGTAYWDANSKWIGTSDLTVYAHWTIKKYTITVVGTNGTVTGSGTYNHNSNVTLSATPDDCFRFVKWSDDNTSNPRTVTVTGDATYTAIFEKVQYTITTAPDNAAHGSTEAVEKP